MKYVVFSFKPPVFAPTYIDFPLYFAILCLVYYVYFIPIIKGGPTMSNQLSVLIVDDEPNIRNGLISIIPWTDINLKLAGIASDGLEAIRMIHQLQPHIIITDIRMPHCDGLELIKHCHNANIHSKIIILSGHDDFKYAQTAIKYNVSSYLLKPIQPKELHAVLETSRDEILEEIKKNILQHHTKHQLLMQTKALKENFYNKLLENEYKHQDELSQHFNALDISLTMSPIRVLVFSYNSNERDPNKDINTDSHAKIIQIIDTELMHYKKLVFSKDSNRIIAIINVEAIEKNSLHTIKKECQNILIQTDLVTNYHLIISFGDTVTSPLNIKYSFLNALEALTYSIYGTGERLFDSSMISKEPSPIIKPQDKLHSEIIDAIYRNDLKEVDKLLYDYFHSLFYVETPRPNYIRGMCIYMVIDVQKGLSAYLESDNGLFKDIPYLTINRLHSFREIRLWITKHFHSYADYIMKHCPYKKDPIIQKAKAYIQDNIYKKIKAEDVAYHVGFSENYFTVYFKEKTNENFKTYVQHSKMEKAKEHLRTSTILIGELSTLLGYEDYRSLNRAFKKETGLTPSEYQGRYHIGGSKR